MNLSEQVKRGFDYNNTLKEGELLWKWKNPFTNYFPEVTKNDKDGTKPVKSPVTPVKTDAYWIAQAQKANDKIKTIEDIKEWQNMLRVTVDGKWGPQTQNAYDTYIKDIDTKSKNQEKAVRQLRNNNNLSKTNKKSVTNQPIRTYNDYLNSDNFRKHYNVNNQNVTIEGVTYPTVVSKTQFKANDGTIYNKDITYAYNSKTGKLRPLKENWFGTPIEWEEEKDWALFELKQGGKMKYFQQGGAVPQQQDIQQQVVALVQAAMQGDQQASQQVNKILEAAKQGDQQAIQIAQMIQQVVNQMKGQATQAKWGAKLSYVKSLKYSKGGKTCPECEKQAMIEKKACGGKKAKKKYFGGWL